jgi:hypothetical protein
MICFQLLFTLDERLSRLKTGEMSMQYRISRRPLPNGGYERPLKVPDIFEGSFQKFLYHFSLAVRRETLGTRLLYHLIFPEIPEIVSKR